MSWLDELKEGDEVFLKNPYNHYIGMVTKVTPKTVVIDGKYTYNKSNGKQRGGNNMDLLELTVESKKQFLLERDKERKVLWVKKSISTFSNEKLIEIYDFLHKKEVA